MPHRLHLLREGRQNKPRDPLTRHVRFPPPALTIPCQANQEAKEVRHLAEVVARWAELEPSRWEPMPTKEYVGRQAFFKAVADALKKAPTHVPQSSFAIVYSTVSGAGKTSAMLQCPEICYIGAIPAWSSQRQKWSLLGSPTATPVKCFCGGFSSLS